MDIDWRKKDRKVESHFGIYPPHHRGDDGLGINLSFHGKVETSRPRLSPLRTWDFPHHPLAHLNLQKLEEKYFTNSALVQRTWLRPLLGVAILIFYALVIELLGFILTTFIFLIIWMWVIERLRWRTILSISIGTTVVLYLIFSFFLEVPLPKDSGIVKG